MIAGPNGAGKTTFTERVLAHQWLAGCQYVNPDLIANERFGGWNEPSAILQAAQEADRGKTMSGPWTFALPTGRLRPKAHARGVCRPPREPEGNPVLKRIP